MHDFDEEKGKGYDAALKWYNKITSIDTYILLP